MNGSFLFYMGLVQCVADASILIVFIRLDLLDDFYDLQRCLKHKPIFFWLVIRKKVITI